MVLVGCGQSAGPGSSPFPSASPSASPSPTPTAQPKPRSNAVWVFDPATKNFVLFGGRYTTGNYHEFPQPLGDTWTWDGTRWTQLPATETAPTARFDATATFDPTHAYVVLNGGGGASDTWTWNGTRWILVGPNHTPPAIGIRTMAGDASLGGALEFVWTDPVMANFQAAVNDLWVWNGADWTQLNVSGATPQHSEAAGAIADDPATGQVIYFEHLQGTPSTWIFNGTSWAQAASSAGTSSLSFAMTRDDSAGGVLLFGSNGDTWTWNGTHWTPQNPLHSPGARVGASLTYDSMHHAAFLFGGYTGTAASLQEHNDIWKWDGSDWTLVSGA